MMTAFSSAVSGLKSQQTSLDVIANNIANTNTTGYKKNRVTFSDLLSQTLSSATGSTNNTGGTNANQVGLGVQVSSTQTLMTVGSTESTGVTTDVAISGEGFFAVKAKSTDDTYYYTRAGSMDVDDNGNLTVDGYQVCGWTQYTEDADGNYTWKTDTDPVALNFSDYASMSPKATTSAAYTGILDSSATATGTDLTTIGTFDTDDADWSSSMTVYDSEGNDYDISVYWKKCATEDGVTTWYWQAGTTDATTLSGATSGYVAFDSEGKLITKDTTITSATATLSTSNPNSYTTSSFKVVDDALAAGTGTVTITNSGSTNSTATASLVYTPTSGTATTYTGTIDSTTGTVTFKDTSGNTVATLALSSSGVLSADSFTVAATTSTLSASSVDPTVTLTATATSGETNPISVALDYSKLTSSDVSKSTVAADDVDGYTTGTLSSYSISSDGTIIGTYSNDETQPLGMLALAVFDNAEGLEKSGNNLYVESANSGQAQYYTAGDGGTSSLTSGALEMSNVDLATEFSNMMISQRAYQANSKVISTADEMLQSLINMVG